MATFWLLGRAFREASLAIDWFAYCRFEGHHGCFAAFGAFDFEHSFLERVESPLLASS
jgi:hypothetical protein